MNPHIFREYDIRGVADRDLSDEVAEGIGRAFGARVKASHTELKPPAVVVGRDCRVSGPRLYTALVRGLLSQGVRVWDIGVGPTPMVYYAAQEFHVRGGIMITGSHNPGDENGFKMVLDKASFFGADIQTLMAAIVAGVPDASEAARSEASVLTIDVRELYLQALVTRGYKGAKKMRVVLDAGNGSGGPLGVEALRRAGIEVEPLYCDMDGTFPNHHPDPTVPKNLEALIARVQETKADLGLAFDGDADRLGGVDGEGNILWGDKLMVLFGRALLKTNPGATIIGEVKCSQTLYDDIAKHGGTPLMWKTGHSLIKTKMKETGALLAGEMSGHLFFADRYFGYDDALYAALRLVEIASNSDATILQQLADLPVLQSTPELRVDCPDAVKFEVVQEVLKHFRAEGFEVNDVDGARITFGTPAAPAWGLVRASNTGPILVLRFEAPSEAELTRIRGLVEAVVTCARASRGA